MLSEVIALVVLVIIMTGMFHVFTGCFNNISFRMAVLLISAGLFVFSVFIGVACFHEYMIVPKNQAACQQYCETPADSKP
jgi:hypothetical protein